MRWTDAGLEIVSSHCRALELEETDTEESGQALCDKWKCAADGIALDAGQVAANCEVGLDSERAVTKSAGALCERLLPLVAAALIAGIVVGIQVSALEELSCFDNLLESGAPQNTVR